MSFDQMYDEMLHDEFSSCGKHQAKAAAVAAEPELAEGTSRGRHAAAEEPVARPRGFQRYRTAALVGAGGMACAAAGAFLGGLGGYFTISPAAAHSVASPTVTQDLPLAQAVSQAAHSSSGAGARGTSAVAAANFSKVSGSLTKGIAPFASLTSAPLQNLPVTGIPGLYGPTGGTGTVGIPSGTAGGGSNGGNGGGGGTGCTSSSVLGLSCILQGLTGVLSNLTSLSGGNPGNLLNGLVPSLGGVVSDVTGTLQNLTSLLPIASLPLPNGGIPTTVLAGTTGPVTSAAGSAGTHSSNPVVSALAPVLNTVGALASGLGSTAPSIPSLPLPSSSGTTLPSLPLGTTPTTVPTASTPSSGTSTGGTKTINVPLPLPLPIKTPTITIGGLSVGINSSGSNSGLTLTLP
jgi:hypothetical protein